MKRLILSTVCMLFCATGLWAQTLIDGIYYKFDENTQTATVTNKIGDSSGSNSYSGSITIPSTVAYNGTSYSVTSIGDYAFNECSGLTSITIPNSVTTIGRSAFKNCTGLTIITIPNSVTTIESSAFSGCNGLTRVTIPNSVTSIGSSAFSNCTGLTSVTIPSSVTSIGISAFSRCTGLTSVTIGEGVTRIGLYAFSGCTGLTNVTIPNSVTTIESSAFSGCTGLTNITIPNSVTSIGAWAFSGCTGLTSVTIPSSVTTIGNYAFYNCEELTSIIVPCEKYDYFVGMLTEYAAIIYENCTFEVAVNANNEDYGTVTGSGVFKMGQTIQLTATANEGYRFKGWSDGVMDASREITVTKDTSITANFVALYTIKALASASQGTVIGGGVYEDGETATLVANPNPGYIFTQWVDGSDENPRTVTVDENKTYTAIFIEEESETTAVSETEESIVETARYDINGRLLTAPTKGVNIVKYSDGSFEKEFVR